MLLRHKFTLVYWSTPPAAGVPCEFKRSCLVVCLHRIIRTTIFAHVSFLFILPCAPICLKRGDEEDAEAVRPPLFFSLGRPFVTSLLGPGKAIVKAFSLTTQQSPAV